MSEVSISLQPESPQPSRPKRPKRKRPAKPRPDSLTQAKSERRAMIGSVVIASIIIHAVILVLFGIWTVAKHFSRPEARFEMKKSVKIPPKTPEHKMNVAKHEAMAPKPTFNDKLVSTRPVEFALPELPQLEVTRLRDYLLRGGFLHADDNYGLDEHFRREIAKVFHLSEQTVHNYRANLMEKLGFHDRLELLKFAIRRGIISVADL